jgi:hypothetical protein
VDGSPFPGSAAISLDDNLGHQDYVHFISLQPSCSGSFVLDDVGLVFNANRSFIIEWSADCNADGIVDYGQILAGQLADTNSNKIPDCCEQGTTCDSNASGLEAYLNFEGDCLDSSGNGRNGVPTAISFVHGPSAPTGFAAAFDGSTSDIRIEGIPIPTNNEFSWALWFRTETIGNIALIERVESIGNNLMSPSLFIRSNGGLGFGSYSFASGGTSIETDPGVVAAQTWIHVACTSATSGLRRLFINGQLIGENFSADYGQPLALMLLGRDRVDCCDRFRGTMDEFHVYSRALTPSEVSALFGRAQQTDCNADGIADYGQCRDGTLPDYNGNNIPDCCERGEACVAGNYPVQWRQEEGGNGHWYFVTSATTGLLQSEAQAAAVALGGHLLSACGQEFDFAITSTRALSTSFWVGNAGPWIGLTRLGGYEWRWLDGTACMFDRWESGQPNNGADVVALLWSGSNPPSPHPLVHDHTNERWSKSFLVEWSADCNSDGIVDYGQILQGQLVDSDQNGVPDVCEVDPCPGDVTNGGSVDATDLSVILAAWGTNGQGEFDADADNSGLVDGGDLALVLSGWGPCPQ